MILSFFGVFDHLIYIAVSKQAFAVPAAGGSLTFSSPLHRVARPNLCRQRLNPASERLFGQGVKATFDNFTLTTTTP